MEDFFGHSEESVGVQRAPAASGYDARIALLRGSKPDESLTNAAANKRLGGALLFYGPQGLGKWEAALGLTAFFNCTNPDVTSALTGACGVCPNCKQIAAGTFPELLTAFPTPSGKDDELREFEQQFRDQKREDPFSIVRWSRPANISIDRAREVRKRLSQKAGEGLTRLVIFYEIEKMRPEASDALLRMVEEPPTATMFIIVATQPESVSQTILSRCQRIRFAGYRTEQIEEFLENSVEDDSLKIDVIARLAQGSPGLALEIADEMQAGEEDVSTREVSWLTFKSLLFESGPSSYDLLKRSVDLRNNAAVDVLVARWRSFLRDLVLLRENQPDLIMNSDLRPELEKHARALRTGDQLYHLIDRLADLTKNLRHNVSANLALADFGFEIRKTFLQP